MQPNNLFGNWLRQRRTTLDLTQVELADRVGCAPVTVKKIENGLRRPSKQIAERLAEALVIPPDERPAFIAFARSVRSASAYAIGLHDEQALRHNLPPPLTSFVGRSGELAYISEHLNNPACRLLSLIGSGGIGKSRLAIEAARAELERFGDGVYFVSLAGITAANQIASTIAGALNISFLRTEEPKVQLVNYLRQKHMLLVPDNFEHLLDGVGYLTTLLENAPGLKLLVTSRERLNLQEEWVLHIEGLSFPDHATSSVFETYPAIQLFAQRAQQEHASFRLADNADSVLAICKMVEGMPLGIELAATWLRVMPCHQIAAQMATALDMLNSPLRNVPERHRSMRAVFDQSWRLLSEQEQAVLMRLSVFRGGFDLDSVGQVAEAHLPIIAALVDKSLIRMGTTGRYEMHEVVRQHAYDKLQDAGETTTTERRHLAYFVELAEEADEHNYRADEIVWLDRLEAEHDNLRAALQWSSTNQQGDLGLKLAAALGWFWRKRNFRVEGRNWFDKLLQESHTDPSPARVKALYFSAWLFRDLGDNVSARLVCEQALAMGRAAGDRRGIAFSLMILGLIVTVMDDGDEAAIYFEESLNLFHTLGDERGINHASRLLARAALNKHDYVSAMRLIEDALSRSRAYDLNISTGYNLGLLGNIVCAVEIDQERAAAFYQESLALCSATGDVCLTQGQLGLASVARAQRNFDQARALYEEMLGLLSGDLNDPYSLTEALWGLGAVARAEGEDAQAVRFYRESLVLNRGLDKWDTAYALAGLGALALRDEQPEQATRLLAAAGTIFAKQRDLYAADKVIFDQDVEACREALGPEAFAAAWAAGCGMSVEQATGYALEQMPVEVR